MLEHQGYKWTLAEATVFVRNLSERVRPAGYDIALAGSVLKKGRSMNDLDVIIFPLSTAKEDPIALLAALQDWGMIRRHDTAFVHKAWRKQGSQDTKQVEIWEYKDKRVDLFFMK
jgi:hypothetical protein